MNKSVIKKSFLALIALLSFSLTFHSCDSWMSDDDDFYEEIENEVKRANAPQISVFVRYAATKMGKTDPDGYSTFKVEIPSKITATTEIDYGFKRWAAFSTSFLTPGDTQYTDFVYEDDESYAANYGQYELSSDIVRFEDPNATTTNVTIFEERNDIYIVPVVAKRPTIALSMPASGSSGIVRNMTVRINFSKPMNPASFKNTNGVVDKITITQGTQSITSDGDIEISSTEITDRFAEPTFSTNGKMITLKFKPEAISEGFTAQSYVTINISKDVTDIYGYAMAEDYKLQFQVGSSFDTLAPRISELTAGIAQAYNTFGGVYKDADTVSALGSLTQIKLDGAAGANADIDNNPLYTDALLAQRIKGKVNIRVVAEDLAGSGSGQDATGAESEVSMIGIKATSIALMSGAAAGESDNIPIKSLAYVGQTNASEIQGSYRDITGANKGFLFTYDVSSLPDGLIKIDVWAYDSIGNSGLLEGGAYSAEYGNGYASIFVVKDTTPPDATANTGLVSTSSASAPYGWYNASTLASMKLYEVFAGAIFDNGHPRLRSKSDKLQWFFNVTSDTSWAQGVSPDDARWVNVSDGYSIANAAVPASDGPVALSLILKDDLGNISTAAPLSSIMYDNTAALVSTPTWVNDDGTDAVNNVTGANKPAQILKIPFDGNISGVRRLGVYVDKCANPLAKATILYAANGEAPNAATVIEGSKSDNIVELPDSYFSGVFYIKGLTIGDTEGLNTVSIDTYDSALNKSATVTRTIALDITNPKINGSVYVNDQFTTTTTANNTKFFLPKSAFEEKNPNSASISFKITELGSGIHTIKISGDGEFRPGYTTLSDLALTDYTVVDVNTIILPDSYNPKIIGDGKLVTINNVQFKNADADNILKIQVSDFLDKDSAVSNSDKIFVDTVNPTIASVEVKDKEPKVQPENGFAVNMKYKADSYTDSNLVNVTVTIGTESSTGVKDLVLSGAEFSGSSAVSGASCGTTTFTGNKVTFEKTLVSGDVVTFTDVQIPDLQGTHIISVTPFDGVKWEGTAVAGNPVIYDKEAPVFTKNPYWTAASGHAVGVANGTYLDNQILHIPFTDATAGINVIRINLGVAGLFDNPVDKNHVKIYYRTPSEIETNDAITYPGTEITGYAITNTSGTIYEIELPDSKTTGEITIQGLKVDIASDVTYTVALALRDAAQNSKSDANNSALQLVHDITAPIVEKIEIPGLRYTKEIAQGALVAGPDESWWIDHEYIGGNHDENYAATQVPLYITINEKTSGVNLITLGGTMKLQSNSTLWTVAENGDETPVEASKYTVNTTANTITINNPSDSLKNASGKDNFVILIKDLMATETGGDANTVSVTVEDVALNESIPNTTITKKGENKTVTGFYTDSLNCALNGVEIIDRGGTITATAGYTNESIVDVYVHASAENKGYSGHNKFKLTGGKFTADSKIYIGMDGTSSSNALAAVKSAPVELTSDKYVISDDTIEFRNAAATEYYVIRNHLALKFTNIQLDNPVEGDNSVTCQPYDLVGWEETSAAKTGSIILDTTKPEIRRPDDTEGRGLYVFNSSESSRVSTLADPKKFVFPHGGTTEGHLLKENEKNGDEKQVHYFYVSAQSSINTTNASYTDEHPIYGTTANPSENVYGVALGIGNSDNIAIKNSQSNSSKVGYYIYKHGAGDTTSTLKAEEILKGLGTGTLITPEQIGLDIGDAQAKTGTSSDVYNRQWFPLYGQDSVTYSVILADQAGNYSLADTFVIVKDVTKPSVKLDDSNSLSEVFTLDIPPESKVFINQSQTANSIANSSTSNNLYDSGEHRSTEYYSTNYVIKETSDDYKIVVKLSGRKTGDTMLDGTSASSDTSAYTQKTPTATDSGLAYYAVSHWYADWCASSDDTSNYYPAFPSTNSNVPNGSSIISYMNYGDMPGEPTGLTSKCSWHPYTEGNYSDTNTNPFDTIKSSVDSDGNISISIPKTEKTPPLALLLKDNCGNMNYILIRPKSMETDQKQTISYIVDNKLGGFKGHCETENGRTKERAVLINPGIDKNGTGATVGSHTFAWGNQSSSYKTSNNHGGVSVTGRLVKNLVTNTTYYNDNAWLCLSVEGGESILFDSKGPTTDTTQYTGRAKLYLSKTELSDSEAYAIISQASTANGIATDWNYYACRSGSDTMHFVFQYPHPDYAALGWAANEPFYIYYLVEDYVGNYDIHKVVNDDSDNMDKWVYDNVAPVLTLVDGTAATKSGDYYLFNSDDISKLLPENNGYRAYTDGSHIYVSMGFDDNHLKPRTGATQNSSVGEGTTRHVEGSIDTAAESRKNLMFYDIKVDSEASGIRAFCYSTNKTSPEISNEKLVSEGNTQGDKGGVWYEGFGAENIHAAIGCDWTYSTDNTNRYDTSEIYKTSAGEYKYSGTKINTIVPHSLINGPTSLYLHVMDWVGNISTYKMGNIDYVNDATIPDNDGNNNTNIYKDDHNITSYDNTPHDLQYTFAATKIPSDVTSLKIYMPEGKYADTGSGLLGWSLTPNDLNSVQKDEKGSYIEITDEELNRIINGKAVEEPISVYVYDNVGNCPYVNLKLVGDKEPIPFTLYVRGMEGETTKSIYLHDTNGEKTDSRAPGDGNGNIKTVTSSQNIITNVSDSTITATVYTSGSSFIFLPNFGTALPSDWYSAAIENWNGTKWVEVATSNVNNQWLKSTAHKDDKYHHGVENVYFNSTTQSISQTNPYYRLTVKDAVGNESYAYIKIVQDKSAPDVQLSGTIGKVNTVGEYNYYSTSSTGKIRYSDTSSGLASYGDVSSVSEYKTKTDDLPIDFAKIEPEPESEEIKFSATDNAGNRGEIPLLHNGKSKWKKVYGDPTAPAIENQRTSYTKGDAEINLSTANFTMLNRKNNTRAVISATNTVDTKITVVSISNMDGVKFKTPVILSGANPDANFLGWIKVENDTLSNTDWISSDDASITKLASGETQVEFTLTNPNGNIYRFYPVDKAGLIGDEPIELKFRAPKVPVVSNIIQSETVTPTGSSVTYFNGSAKLFVDYSSELPVSSYLLIAGDEQNEESSILKTGTISGAAGTGRVEISLSDFSASSISEKPLYVALNTEEGASELKQVTTNTWTWDSTPPHISVTGVTSGEGFNIVAEAGKNYFNNATIDYSVTDTLVTHYAITTSELVPGSWSDYTDSMTISMPSGANGESYYLHFKDIMGYSACKAITANSVNAWVHDADAPTGTLSIDYTNEGNGYYLNGTTLYYNTSLQSSTELAPAGYTDDIFAGYTIGDTETPAAKITYTPSGTSFDIYAYDKVGNKAKAGTVNLVSASTVEATGGAASNVVYTGGSGTANGFGAGVISISGIGTASTVYGYESHSDYASYLYTKDATLTVPVTSATGNIAYAFKTGKNQGTEPAAYSGFQSLTEGKLAVIMPSVTGPNEFIWIYLKDEVGNKAVYNVGTPDKPGENWMLEYNENTGSVTYAVSAGNFGWVGGNLTSTVTLTITGLVSTAPIKTITLESLQNNVTWAISSVQFNSAIGSYTQGASLNGSQITLNKDSVPLGGTVVVTLTATSSDSNLQGQPGPSVKIESITDVRGAKVTPTIPTTLNAMVSRISAVASSAAASIKSLFTPKSKKVDLTAQSRIADKSEITNNNRAVASVPASEIPELVKKSELPSAKAKPVKNQPARTKKIASRSADSIKVSSISTVSPVLPENAKVLEAKPIQLSVENEEHITNVVENNPSPQRRVPLSFVIFTTITVIVIAGMFITSKKIIDMYN